MKVLIALALLAPTSDAAGLRASRRSRRLADQLDLSRLEEAAGEGRLGAGISFKLDGSHKMSLAGEKSRLATAVARRMDCGEATRLFRDAGKHEAAQKAAGLDLWYAVRCAAADGDETKEAKSQKTLKRLRRFLDSESHDGVAFIEPELEKTLTREDILPGFLAEQDERRLQQTYQYRLIKANHECNSDDAWLGSFGTVKGCADECLQTEGCRFFIYGKIGTQGDKAGWCYHEKTSDATCSKDWESDSYDFYALELMPNPDPYYAAQKPTYDLIRLPRAWEAANLDLLKDVVVNVVDSGIDLSHEDLKDAIWKNPGETCGNGLDDDNNGFVDDCYGYNFADNTGTDLIGEKASQVATFGFHGTFVAGQVAADTNNGKGIASVAGGAKIMTSVIFGKKSHPRKSHCCHGEAIIYGANNGAKISLNSWTYLKPNEVEQSVLDAIDYANTKGGVVVAAAGNSGSEDPFYPAAYGPPLWPGKAGAVAVAAVDNSKVAGPYPKSTTEATNFGSHIDISAPGINMYGPGPKVGISSYWITSGTSMAAPIVAGVFALGYSVNPSLSREHLLRCMKDTAINLDAENAGKSALGHQVKGGYAEKLGAGLIDARAFVECASQCFSDPGVPVAGCECHDTCATCGFSDSPTGDSDCITCKNGDPVNKQNGDATGTCDRSGPPSCFVRHPTMPDAAWKCESRCEGHKAPWREKCAWTSNDCAGCFECEWSRHAFWLTPGLPIHCKCHDTCATCGFNPEPTPTGDSDCITCKNGGPVTKVWDDGTGRCAQSSQGGKKNRRATPIVIIVICCAAVVVVVAVLFGWNRRAVALKQLHRDSSLPMPEGDVEVSAD